MRKNILIIAYLFPPIGGSGAIRPLKLSKYLPQFEWDPIILTVQTPDYYYARDSFLLEEIPGSTIIKRSFMLKVLWIYRLLNPLRIHKIDLFIKKYFIHPDQQIGWIPFAFHSGMNILRKHKINAIYSTSGPLSCHLIAYLLKKKTGITWVSEFRDEWFEDPGLDFPTPFHRRFHYRLEEMIVNYSDRIITMAPVFARLLSKHKGISHKISTITAGYDPGDIHLKKTSEQKNKSLNKFITVFTGLFYDSFRPINFLKAIEELIEEGLVNKDDVIVQFVGANTREDLGIEDTYKICEFTGFLPRKKSLNYLFEADLSLLLLSRERGKDVIPSKIFEYMSSGKPILGVIPSDGDAAGIIRKTNSGIVTDYDNLEEIKNGYLEFYKKWQNNEILNKNNRQEIEKFDQKHLTKELVDILNHQCL